MAISISSSRAAARPVRCCATTVTAASPSQAPFGAGSSAPLRGFAWADVDGDGVPDAALLDGTGRIRVLLNLRGGFREQALPAGMPPALAIAAADVSGDGLVDVLALAADGARRAPVVAGRSSRVSPPPTSCASSRRRD